MEVEVQVVVMFKGLGMYVVENDPTFEHLLQWCDYDNDYGDDDDRGGSD